jgi:hypothetical protein
MTLPKSFIEGVLISQYTKQQDPGDMHPEESEEIPQWIPHGPSHHISGDIGTLVRER